jgi:hypothetical protein
MAEFKTILDMELAKKKAFIPELKAGNKEMIAQEIFSLTEFLNKYMKMNSPSRKRCSLQKLKASHIAELADTASLIVKLELGGFSKKTPSLRVAQPR